MRNTTAIIVILIFFHQLTVTAQKKPVSGYIVQGGDTIYGYILMEKDQRMREYVKFRKDGSEMYHEYTKYDISAYSYENTFYFERIETDTLVTLAQCLVKGYLSLYRYPDANERKMFFVKTSEGRVIELINTITTINVEDRILQHAKNEYVSSLILLMGDSPDMRAAINKCDFKAGDLSELIHSYNSSLHNNISSQVYKESIMVIKKYVTAGIVLNKKVLGVVAGAGVSLRPFKPTSVFRFNIGFLLGNTLETDDVPLERWFLNMPLYCSLYVLNNRALEVSWDIGVNPHFCIFDRTYRRNELSANIETYFGASLDYNLKNSTTVKLNTCLGLEGLFVTMAYVF